ncbi:hypothetical protein B0H10DRAFT_2052506 [Mycena sp. CBHHK59/15]|nr:hypothetical protein B0H10DRAFT_2052506 [Mycena sp. CBHHK59/15]
MWRHVKCKRQRVCLPPVCVDCASSLSLLSFYPPCLLLKCEAFSNSSCVLIRSILRMHAFGARRHDTVHGGAPSFPIVRMCHTGLQPSHSRVDRGLQDRPLILTLMQSVAFAPNISLDLDPGVGCINCKEESSCACSRRIHSSVKQMLQFRTPRTLEYQIATMMSKSATSKWSFVMYLHGVCTASHFPWNSNMKDRLSPNASSMV